MKQHFPALAFRSFRIFLIGQFISLIGTWMQSTTQPYLAYRLTNQPFYLGLVGFSSTLPALFFTLPMGVLVERWNKRLTVILMQIVMMLQALTLGFITLMGWVTIWHIIILAFILGIANSIEITARQAMLVELSDRESISNAIALNSTVFNAARILGPSLAAPFLVFIQGSGEGWAFIANGVSYLFVIFSLLIIKTRPVVIDEQPKESFLKGFSLGQEYIRHTPLVALLIILVAIMGFFGFPFMQQIPVYAAQVLQTANDTAADTATRNSLLLSFMGIGAVAGSIVLAAFSDNFRKGKLLIIGQGIFSLSLILLSFTRVLPFSLIWMMLMGLGMVTSLALTNTLIQLTVPDELRGRVISTYLWGMQGIAPFGSLFLGWLIQTIGMPSSLLICGSVCLGFILIIHGTNRTVRSVAG